MEIELLYQYNLYINIAKITLIHISYFIQKLTHLNPNINLKLLVIQRRKYTELDKGFLATIQKAQSIKDQINKLNFMIMENLCPSKDY